MGRRLRHDERRGLTLLCPRSSLGAVPSSESAPGASGRSVELDTGDVGGEEVDAVAIEIAARPIVVLSGSRIGMTGEDLRITERDAGIHDLDMEDVETRKAYDSLGRRLIVLDNGSWPVDMVVNPDAEPIPEELTTWSRDVI